MDARCSWHGMDLNNVGEIVYRHVVNLLTTLEASRRRVREHQDQAATKLTLGASLTIAEYLLPHALPAMERDLYTNLVVRMANPTMYWTRWFSGNSM